jgi:hypothetical protein
LVHVLNVAGMAGLMVAVATFFWANRLLPVGLVERSDWEINVFFSVWGLTVLHALLRNGRQGWSEQLALGALLFAGLPVLDIFTGGGYLLASLQQQDWVLIGFDLTALVIGLFMAWGATKFRPVRPIIAARHDEPSATKKHRQTGIDAGQLEGEVN